VRQVEDWISRYRILPVSIGEKEVLAVGDPRDRGRKKSELRQILQGRKLNIQKVDGSQFQRWVENLLGTYVPQKMEAEETHAVLSDVSDLESIFRKAWGTNASDIELEQQDRGFQIRFRIDGEWSAPNLYPPEYGRSLIARIRTLAHLNPGKFSVAQEGHFDYSLGPHRLQFRLSELATATGSHLILRSFSDHRTIRDIHKLGLPEDILSSLKSLFQNPTGLFLTTGPTGSGKTTSLYSFLHYLSSESRKILTVEDPIEYPLPGIVQTEVTAKVRFPTFLKALLRQDPDIVMVGEIRDEETAQMATQAALTGHFILSTVHSKSSVDVLLRLREMNVDGHLLASTVTGILSQRLVQQKRGSSVYSQTHGGRRAIFEWFPVGEATRSALATLSGNGHQKLRESAQQDGFIPFAKQLETLQCEGEIEARDLFL
jgi:type II secretory ATPase GspE/PulE/Tfp pilus assembly ATPase PilB-like protein